MLYETHINALTYILDVDSSLYLAAAFRSIVTPLFAVEPTSLWR